MTMTMGWNMLPEESEAEAEEENTEYVAWRIWRSKHKICCLKNLKLKKKTLNILLEEAEAEEEDTDKPYKGPSPTKSVRHYKTEL